tara:strand:+ start:1229 stop:2377 length:1149 start_codon:yes stop_codon:yes gene_type:complete
MSVGNNLQKMENIEENAVTKGAKPAEPMQKLSTGGTPATWEDLGGPTPENYKSDDDSAKLKTPGATLKQVKDVVNKGAKPAEGAKGLKKEEEEKPADQVVSEEETTEEEVVAEEETTEVEETQEVVAEEETTEEEVVEEKIDVDADINALIEGEKLSEEFETKARTIFESAIKAKVAELSEQVKISYEEKLVEEVSEIKKELQERVDSYLEYVASEWLEENQLAAEAGLKTEMTESFLEGMKSLFEEHYVTIPEDKYDVLNSMVDKLDEMENKLNEQIKSNVALNRRLAESVADVIFAEVTEGLADSQRDKLASLAENVEFESEEDYREKLVTLRESYFPSKSGTQRDKSENLSEGDEASTPQPVSGLMESYLQTMSRVSKK